MRKRFCVGLVVFVTLLAAGVIAGGEDVFADQSSSDPCSEWYHIDSVRKVCDMSASERAMGRGMLWIGDKDDAGSDIRYNTTSGTATAGLWGMVSTSSGNAADQIKITYDQSATQPVTYMEWPSEMNRGAWGTAAYNEVTIDVAAFIADPHTKTTETAAGIEYSQSVYVYRCWKGSSMGASACYPDDSTLITLIVPGYNFKTAVKSSLNTDIVYAGESVTPRGEIEISLKDPKKSQMMIYNKGEAQLIEFYVKPGVGTGSLTTLLGGQYESSSAPCAYFQGKLGGNLENCVTVDSKSGLAMKPGTTVSMAKDSSVRDITPGYKYCTATGVKPSNSGTGTEEGVVQKWNISNASCRTIAKKPHAQVTGGHIYSEGDITGATSAKYSRLYGSWGEYLAISNGNINQFGSGAALNVGNTAGLVCGVAPLTIANTNCSALGKADITAQTNFADLIKKWFEGGVYDRTVADGGEIGDGLGDFPKGETLFIHNNGTIKITKNIAYTGDKLGNASEIPKIIVMAKNIEIDTGVTRVDAWLIADGGMIDDCPGVGVGTLSVSTCNSQLTINGLIYAKSLALERTAGASSGATASATPAEMLHFDVSSYLYGKEKSREKTQALTVYLQELAPRL